MYQMFLKRYFFVAWAIAFTLGWQGTASAYEVLDNDLLRFGTGTEASVNTSGNLQQPFYYDPNIGGGTFAKLTFSNYPLDNAIGIDGDGTSIWNINGTIQENSALSGQVLDLSGFTITSGSKGTGTIVSIGTVTIAGKTLEVRNTYELLPNKSFIKINTRVTNTSGAPVSNLRYWVGTRDDYVGNSDVPTKQRGNLVDGAFQVLTNAADQSSALKIYTATSGVLFYSTSPKANTSINGCCSFSNAYGQNPATSNIEATNDGSYALYIRMDDLNDGASEEFTWYYAAGEVSKLDDIAADVAAAAVVGKNLDEDTTATFGATDFVDTNDVTLEKIRIASLPTHGTLNLSGAPVSVSQEIPSANYGNLVYTPDANFHGNDLFTFEAYVDPNYLPAVNANLIVAPINDLPTGTVSISGTATAGATLTAQNTLADIDGLGTLNYQWRLDGAPIAGATTASYDVATDDAGHALTVTISYVDDDGTTESVTSASVGADDSDGIAPGVESLVPNPDGSGNGDGNGDGTPDDQQSNVASLAASGGSAYSTIVSLSNRPLISVAAATRPADFPAGASSPLGAFTFIASGVANGATEDFELYIPYNPNIVGAMKKNRLTGVWEDVATAVTHIGTTRTKISFSLTDGGPYDADDLAGNGQIADPIVPFGAGGGSVASVPTLSQWGIMLLSLLVAGATVFLMRRRLQV